MIGLPKKPSLTRRQREIYEFLRDKILNRGYGPTVREIGQEFQIKSPNGVMCHLKALERKGLISREQNMSRAIQLADGPLNRLNVTVLGTAMSDGPLRGTSSPDEVTSFHSVLEGPDLNAVLVSGNGYLNAHVCDGDCLLLRRDLPVQRDCHVVAVDDQKHVVICRVLNESGALQAIAPAGRTVTSSNQVLGVITGVIRRFRVPQAAGVRPSA